jgi:hypothetical protein
VGMGQLKDISVKGNYKELNRQNGYLNNGN